MVISTGLLLDVSRTLLVCYEVRWGQKAMTGPSRNGQMRTFQTPKWLFFFLSSVSWAGCPWFLLWPVVKGVLSFDGERDHTQSNAVICMVACQRTLLAAFFLSLHSYQCFFSLECQQGTRCVFIQLEGTAAVINLGLCIAKNIIFNWKVWSNLCTQKLLSQVSSKRKI